MLVCGIICCWLLISVIKNPLLLVVVIHVTNNDQCSLLIADVICILCSCCFYRSCQSTSVVVNPVSNSS